MPQRLKDEVRDRILAAAAQIFAENGYSAARLTDVAARADTSPSNLYKYYDDKAALFAAVVTPTLANRFLKLLRARLDTFTSLQDWTHADAEHSPQASALLDFWIQHRLVVVILLRGAQDSRYSHMRGKLVNEMTRRSLRHAGKTGKNQDVKQLRFVLNQIFNRTLDTIADILLAHEDPDDIRMCIGYFWRYQLAGLAALLNE